MTKLPELNFTEKKHAVTCMNTPRSRLEKQKPWHNNDTSFHNIKEFKPLRASHVLSCNDSFDGITSLNHQNLSRAKNM